MARVDNFRALFKLVVSTHARFDRVALVTDGIPIAEMITLFEKALLITRSTVTVTSDPGAAESILVLDAADIQIGGFSHFIYIWVIPSASYSQFKWIILQEPVRVGASDRLARLNSCCPASVTGNVYLAPATAIPLTAGITSLTTMLDGLSTPDFIP